MASSPQSLHHLSRLPSVCPGRLQAGGRLSCGPREGWRSVLRLGGGVYLKDWPDPHLVLATVSRGGPQTRRDRCLPRQVDRNSTGPGSRCQCLSLQRTGGSHPLKSKAQAGLGAEEVQPKPRSPPQPGRLDPGPASWWASSQDQGQVHSEERGVIWLQGRR